MLIKDLQKLIEWSQDWQMQFNIDKCAVMHMGRKNQSHEYNLGNDKLKKVTVERDIRIIVDKSCKFSEQCESALKCANITLGMIKRNITCKSKKS